MNVSQGVSNYFITNAVPYCDLLAVLLLCTIVKGSNMQEEKYHEEQLKPINGCNGDEMDVIREDVETYKTVVTRDRWSNRFEFLFAIIGYTVGIGSIWRFPILCAKNGGGAFLIPFFFFMITCGGPLYYLEVCLGQFCGKSAGDAFHFCPLFRGKFLIMLCTKNRTSSFCDIQNIYVEVLAQLVQLEANGA